MGVVGFHVKDVAGLLDCAEVKTARGDATIENDYGRNKRNKKTSSRTDSGVGWGGGDGWERIQGRWRMELFCAALEKVDLDGTSNLRQGRSRRQWRAGTGQLSSWGSWGEVATQAAQGGLGRCRAADLGAGGFSCTGMTTLGSRFRPSAPGEMHKAGRERNNCGTRGLLIGPFSQASQGRHRPRDVRFEGEVQPRRKVR